MRIAAETTPLLIKAVFAGTVEGSELEMFQSGMAYDELQHGHVMRKQPGQPARHFKYRGDETVHLAADLNRANADMIITSGHARQRIWYHTHPWHPWSYGQGSLELPPFLALTTC